MLIKTRGGISVAFPGRLTIFHQPHPSLRRLTRDSRKGAVRVGQYTLQLQMKNAYLTLHPIHRLTPDPRTRAPVRSHGNRCNSHGSGDGGKYGRHAPSAAELLMIVIVVACCLMGRQRPKNHRRRRVVIIINGKPCSDKCDSMTSDKLSPQYSDK